MNKEFTQIMSEISQKHEAVLQRKIEGITYTRAFATTERLILLGAGHVSQAVSRFAAMLDFDITVVDDRVAFANATRFPDSAEIICEEFVTAIHDMLNIHERDYICVLTRGHQWDADCLRAILAGTMPFYLGMIGSRRRVAGLMSLLKDEGFDPKLLSEIHSPIGLPIRAVTPEEIAVSILGEIIQMRRSRPKVTGQLEQTNVPMEMLRYIVESNTPKALLLVVDTHGSTPQKTGAMMVVDKAGRTFGTVGGGCSEGEALVKAAQIIGTERSEMITVEMTNEVAADEGMVCGGTMKILIEDLKLE